jgi:hypothetical protein
MNGVAFANSQAPRLLRDPGRLSSDGDIRVMNTEQRIAAVLQKRFPNNSIAPNHFGELLTQYADSGLSPPHLVTEIETGNEGKLWSYIWEAMLYRHLCSMDYPLRNSVRAAGQHGPDFGVEYQGRTIWIEATVPSPEGIPADWLEPPRTGEYRVKTKPDQQRVLRCTSAIDAKQKKFAEYRAKGIVGASDCAVIAVNICRLSDWDVDGKGISQLPLVMEALFPIGPLGVPITREGKLDGSAQHMPRFAVKKANGREIQTANFLDPLFANVSAVVQGHQKDMFEQDLVLSTVHNPLASNPLPTGLFGTYTEFVAEERGNEYQIGNAAMKG